MMSFSASCFVIALWYDNVILLFEYSYCQVGYVLGSLCASEVEEWKHHS